MQQRRVKILLVGHGLGFEGAPRVFVNLARGLAGVEWLFPEVLVHEDGPLRLSLEQARIPVHILPECAVVEPLPVDASGLDIYVSNNLRFLRDPTSTYPQKIASLAAIIAQYAPDIVLANTVLSFWAIAAGKLLGIPTMWLIHESEEPFSHLRILGREVTTLLPSYLNMASKVIFVSKMTENIFRTVGTGENFTVIPNALFPDMPVFNRSFGTREQARASLGIANGTVSLLLLGSVFERKGQIDLVKAMACLPPDVLGNVCCNFVGDRPGTEYSIHFHEAVDALSPGVRSHVRIYKETQAVARHYAAADVFIFCSRIESSPLAILEALSMGLPIITTPVFGVMELLDETCALFYEPGQVVTLAEHVALLVRHPEMRKDLAIASSIRYSKLPDFNRVTSCYAALIAEFSTGVCKTPPLLQKNSRRIPG